MTREQRIDAAVRKVCEDRAQFHGYSFKRYLKAWGIYPEELISIDMIRAEFERLALKEIQSA